LILSKNSGLILKQHHKQTKHFVFTAQKKKKKKKVTC
jgi:hypothetical protein